MDSTPTTRDGQLTGAEKRRLAGRARTLHERLERPVDPGADPDNDVDEILDDWADRVGGPAAFHERLEQLGTTEAACKEALASNDWPADDTLPPWTERIDDLLSFLAVQDRAQLALDDLEETVPFAEVVEVPVAYAREQCDALPAGDEASTELLANSAIEDLEWRLRDRVLELFAQPLFVDFKTYVAERDETLAFGDDRPVDDPPTEYYDQFTSELLSGGLRSFLLEYSFLARSLATVIDQWIAAVEEFTDRLAADYDALCERFADGDDLGRLTAVGKAGDRHGDGRATRLLEFSTGTRAVYKPRSVDVSVAFFEIVDWIDRRSDEIDLRTVEYVPRDGYGWMEWVEHEPCEDADAAERFYRRTGQLIAILYALRFYDGHLENLVANGEQPVLVDLETVGRPVVDFGTNLTPNLDLIQDTVLETNLLPEQDLRTRAGDTNLDDEIPDLGGLNSPEVTWGGLQIPEFEHPNTDLMELTFTDEHTSEENNLPVVDGSVVEPRAHAAAISDGFETAYGFFLDRREEILAADGPLEALEGKEVRYLVAPTFWYGRLLGSLESPSYLRTGIEYGCRLELLSKRQLERSVHDWPDAVYEAERRSLYRLDVPRFASAADSTDLRHDDRIVGPSMFEDTAIGGIRDRIRGFDEADLERQRTLFDLAFSGQIDHQRTRSTVDRAPEAADLDVASRTRAVYEDVRAASTTATTGEAERTWAVAEGSPAGIRADEIETGLYGRVGLGLFGACLWAVEDDPEYRAFATNVVGPTLDAIDEGSAGADWALGAVGFGGTIYGLTTIADLLGDDRFLQAARSLARQIPRERYESDELRDVLHGNAGAILGLATLYEATGDDAVLDEARFAGEQLLVDRQDHDGFQVWETTPNAEIRQGLAHGVSGIAYALGRLSALSDEPRFADAATESLAFERALYDEALGNWRDLRYDADDAHTQSWCHGTAGIGLARLGLSACVDDPDVERDLELALEAVDSTTVLPVDHLCCGNASRIDWLVEAGRRLDDADALDAARRLATATVERADETGGFRGPHANGHRFSPDFFGGQPGVGYSLLRVAEPSLPCISLFD